MATMELKLIGGLEHQQIAVDDIVKVFDGVSLDTSNRQTYENPIVTPDDAKLLENIQEIQKETRNNVHKDFHSTRLDAHILHLDIKMETGTGKTYVYTHAIYELHKCYGINKFVVIVPTLSIKAGAKQFMSAQYVLNHFRSEYGTEIELQEVVPQKNAKKGRKQYPASVSNFFGGSHMQNNKIYVLLLSPQLLTGNSRLLTDNYDRELFGAQGTDTPLNAISMTRPFLIIDEPHRFSRDQKAYDVIQNQIKPQCIIRFGATYPDVTIGKGKNKVTKKDYINLLYNLNACQSFNQGLIKGIAKEHFEPTNKKNEKIKITCIESKTSVTFQHKLSDSDKSYTLKKGDSLAQISREMDGLVVDEIGTNSVLLSNGSEKRKGEEFEVDAYASSYQEQMIKLAIARHFETERNKFNRSPKIKTLALFFIDDVISYRGDTKNDKTPWLKDCFERLLKDAIDEELKTAQGEYKDFLEASKVDIGACHAGYFAQDNSDSDEDIAKEVDDILRNKTELLSIKGADGNWKTRRFLFSKWTLKEGWDNPNVFTIAKLRSSGSENSKLQEVGRGLRLPVDENGNRISNEEFQLNYIVDFTEKDFADRLVAEINTESSSNVVVNILTPEQIEEVANKRGVDKNKLLIDLFTSQFVIDITTREINIAKIDDFYAGYPEFKPAGGVNSSKIINRNKGKSHKIKVREAKYNELKDLWKKLNKKYVVYFDEQINQKIESEIDSIIATEVFAKQTITSKSESVIIDNGEAVVVNESGVEYYISGKKIPYNEFLKRANKVTSIPMKLLHEAICKYAKAHTDFTDEYFNENTLARFVSKFNEWKTNKMLGCINYKQANYNSLSTKLTDENGNVLKEVAQADIGVLSADGKVPDTYLYESLVFDSELEKKNILNKVDEVVVFGKIPRRSISIPTIDGTYSPDFMYVVKNADGSQELNVIIETKGVDDNGQLRLEEKNRIECAKKFFEQMQKDGVNVKFKEQINNQSVLEIVTDLMNLEK